MTALTYTADNAKNMKHGGTYGNTAKWSEKLALGGLTGLTSTTGDVITVDFMRLPAGSIVDTVQFNNTAFGAGSTLDVGFKYIDNLQTVPVDSEPVSSNCFLSAVSLAANSSGIVPIMPIHLSIPAVVQLKFSGATGEQVKKTVASLYLCLSGVSNGA